MIAGAAERLSHLTDVAGRIRVGWEQTLEHAPTFDPRTVEDYRLHADLDATNLSAASVGLGRTQAGAEARSASALLHGAARHWDASVQDAASAAQMRASIAATIPRLRETEQLGMHRGPDELGRVDSTNWENPLIEPSPQLAASITGGRIARALAPQHRWQPTPRALALNGLGAAGGAAAGYGAAQAWNGQDRQSADHAAGPITATVAGVVGATAMGTGAVIALATKHYTMAPLFVLAGGAATGDLVGLGGATNRSASSQTERGKPIDTRSA